MVSLLWVSNENQECKLQLHIWANSYTEENTERTVVGVHAHEEVKYDETLLWVTSESITYDYSNWLYDCGWRLER